MNNYDKRLAAEMVIVFALSVMVLGSVFMIRSYRSEVEKKCAEAGGVPVSVQCINPSAVIEFDR